MVKKKHSGEAYSEIDQSQALHSNIKVTANTLKRGPESL